MRLDTLVLGKGYVGPLDLLSGAIQLYNLDIVVLLFHPCQQIEIFLVIVEQLIFQNEDNVLMKFD